MQVNIQYKAFYLLQHQKFMGIHRMNIFPHLKHLMETYHRMDHAQCTMSQSALAKRIVGHMLKKKMYLYVSHESLIHMVPGLTVVILHNMEERLLSLFTKHFRMNQSRFMAMVNKQEAS